MSLLPLVILATGIITVNSGSAGIPSWMFEDEPHPLKRLFDREVIRQLLIRWIRAVALIFVLEAAFFFFVADQPLSAGEMNIYSQGLSNLRDQISGSSPVELFLQIFLNNFRASLTMYPPILGQFYFVLIGYNTARTIEVIAIQSGLSSNYLMTRLYMVPHTWIELSAYALATTEGLYIISLFMRMIGRRNSGWKKLEHELLFVPITLLLTTCILLVAAAFEVAEIQYTFSTQLLFWIPFAMLVAGVLFAIRVFGLTRAKTTSNTLPTTTRPVG